MTSLSRHPRQQPRSRASGLRSCSVSAGSLTLLSPSPLLSARLQPDRAHGPARGLGVPGGAQDRCFPTPAAASFGLRRMEISSAAVQGSPIQTLVPPIGPAAREPKRRSDSQSEWSLKPIPRTLVGSVSHLNEITRKAARTSSLVSSGQHSLLTHSACFLDKCSKSPPYTLYHDLGTGKRNPRRSTRTNTPNRVAS